MMDCPVCKEPMVVLELNEIEVDYCTGCSGIWLDAGELELLIENESERKKLLSTFKEDLSHPEKSYKCPICSKKMIKVHVGHNKEVLIDKCVNNHGLWFDKGELQQVFELFAEEANKVIILLKEMFENKLSTSNSGEKT